MNCKAYEIRAATLAGAKLKGQKDNGEPEWDYGKYPESLDVINRKSEIAFLLIDLQRERAIAAIYQGAYLGLL